MRRRAFHVLAPLAFLFFFAVPASAQITTQTIVSGVIGLIAFVQDPSVPNTFYLVQRTGTIWVLQNGSVLLTPFLDLSSAVTTDGPEQGLLGMAFHPNPSSNWVFVNFTNTAGDTVVARFTRDPGNPPQAVPGSRLDLLWPTGERVIRQPAANHNGGHLAFGPDGFLYIGLGDGGGGNDTFDNAQNPNSLLGKMLRLDVNVDPSDPKGYRVPPSNPFVAFIPFGEIWDIGLRNPWRYSFDNVAFGGTGALIIADVGQSAREEVNYEPAGRGARNYGWPAREGSIATPGVNKPLAPLPPVNPLFDYPRTVGVAVTGGYVYRGSALPSVFRGRYFVGDWASGLVGSVGLTINASTREATIVDAIDHTAALGGDALGQVSSFAEDLSGELYILRYDSPGAVYKIVSGCSAPSVPANLNRSVSGNFVSLTWSPAPGASGYVLEVGLSSGGVTLSLPLGAGTSVSGVAPSGTYFARVRSQNACGLSLPSNQLVVVVP